MKTNDYEPVLRPLTIRGIISAACRTVSHGGNADAAFAVASDLLSRRFSGPAYDLALVSLTGQLKLAVEERRLASRSCAVKGCGHPRCPESQGCAEHAAVLVRRTCVDVEAIR